jgi:hypothetical protein
MRGPMFVRTGIFALLASGFVCGVSVPAYASGNDGGTAAKRPAPDTGKIIYTNEDLEAKYGKPTPAGEIANAQALSASAEATTAVAPARKAAPREPLPPEKNPVWYAQQTVALNDQIADIDTQAQRLIAFRTSDTAPGPGTGLILEAPCEGITTDNRIAQLLEQRQETEAQISDLEDTARLNGMPPGIFTNASAIAQAAEQPPQLTPEEERAALADQLEKLTQELAQTQAVVQQMQQGTAAQGMTLLPPNGYGGNMTTDLLERLGAKTDALQSQLSSVEDDALRAGIPARDLP